MATKNKLDFWKNKSYMLLTQCYQKAPFFSDVVDLFYSVFKANYTAVSDLAIESIVAANKYVGTPINYTKSSI